MTETRSQALSGAASQGYAFVSAWERKAPLNGIQLSAISALADCGELPEPGHLAEDKARHSSQTVPETPRAGADSGSPSHRGGGWEGAVLRTTAQFYTWYSDLAGARQQRAEAEHSAYLEALQARLEVAQGAAAHVTAALEALDSLAARQQQVAVVRRQCERKMHERDMLSHYGSALAARLASFDELEDLSRAFAALSNAPGSQGALALLARIDDSLAYMAARPQYADTSAYAAKLHQLQGRVVGLVMNHAQHVLQRGIAAARAASAAPAQGDMGGDAALATVRFRAAVEPSLRPLLAALAERRGIGEAARLRGTIEAACCKARAQVAVPLVQAHLERLASALSLREFARQGAAHVHDACRNELALAAALFPSGGTARATAPEAQSPARKSSRSSNAALGATATHRGMGSSNALSKMESGKITNSQANAGAPLRGLIEALCHTLHDALRPRCLKLHSVEELADLVDALRSAHASDGDDGSGVRDLIGLPFAQVIADVQERLMIRAAAFLREDVTGYKPDEAAMNFPACLTAAHVRASAADAPADGSETPATPTAASGPAPPVVSDNAAAAWYAPLRCALALLARLYRTLEPPAFAAIGQDALRAATAAVAEGARGVASRAGALDGHLFAIRHLLLLREQITPFAAELRADEVDRDLDFSHMRGQLGRVLSGAAPLFALSRDNAVAAMVTPRVTESRADGKAELEAALRSACEALIMAVTKLASEPLLAFLHKVSAARATAQKAGKAVPPLSQQAFAAPSKVAAVVNVVNDALARRYPAAIAKLQLYIIKPKARSALLRPIRSNIAEAHKHLAALLQEDYAAEEAATVPLLDTGSLEATLDAAEIGNSHSSPG